MARLGMQSWCFAGLDPPKPMPKLKDDKYVAFVSGLGVGDEGGDPLRLALIVDYLTAQLGSAAEQSSIASKVGRPTWSFCSTSQRALTTL